MEVEKCNWALCKTPNCLTSNTNSVVWLPVVWGRLHTNNSEKREYHLLFFPFVVSLTARRPDLSAIVKTKSHLCNGLSKVSPLGRLFSLLHFNPSFYLIIQNWPSDYDEQPEPRDSCCAADPRLHSLPSRGFSSGWLVTWYCPICRHDGGLKTGRTRQ